MTTATLTAECPDCEGAGWITVNNTIPRDPQCDRDVRCGECRGTGEVDAEELRERLEDERSVVVRVRCVSCGEVYRTAPKDPDGCPSCGAIETERP